MTLNCAIGLAQTDSLALRNIEIKSYLIDSNLGSVINRDKIEIDTIRIRTIRYVNKLHAKFKFRNKKQKLTSEFYFDNGNLQLIRFIEISDKVKKYGAKKVTKFYYIDGLKVDEKVGRYVPGILAGRGVPKDIDSAHGYNEKWTTVFLLELAEKIIEKTIQ